MATNLAREAEKSYNNGNLKGVYESTKKLCNEQQRRVEVIRDEQGKMLTTEKEVLDRWKQHFKNY